MNSNFLKLSELSREAVKELRGLGVSPEFSQSEIFERSMRIGCESRACEATPEFYEDIALMTLRIDLLKTCRNYLNWGYPLPGKSAA